MKLLNLPPPGFTELDSKLAGIQVFAPVPKIDSTPESVIYKCPQCGANTSFSPGDRGVLCQNCGYTHIKEDNTVGKSAPEQEFTLESLSVAERGWNVDLTDIHCQSCGAYISINFNELSSTCSFCGSNKVISRVSSQEILRPRFLIPFKLGAKDCKPSLQDWLKKGWMHPTGLKHAALTTSLQGTYFPFWTFSATIKAEWRAEVGYERTERYYDHNNNRWRTRTKIDWKWESGQLNQKQNDWLGIGTTKASKILIKRLYPFDMNSLTNYDPEFLAGWQALNYDIHLQDAWDEAKAGMREIAKNGCRNQINSNHIRNFSLLADFDHETWRLILLPIYVSTYRFEGQNFQILINGQTGTVAGQKPIAWWKVWLAIGGILSPGILLGAIGLVFLLFGGVGIFILGLAAVLFVIGIVISIYIFQQATQAGDL